MYEEIKSVRRDSNQTVFQHSVIFSEAEERKSQLATAMNNIQSFSNGALAGNELLMHSK